jgi:hypothetical protein
MNFDVWITTELAPRTGPGFVYVLFWMGADNREVPFYVGQTQSAWGRFNDYYWADFRAATDFKVGEAVRYLWERNYRVIARYTPSANPSQDENDTTAKLSEEKNILLNRRLGYSYRQGTTEAQQRARVRRFIDDLLADKISN